jgi:hypothetical protein
MLYLQLLVAQALRPEKDAISRHKAVPFGGFEEHPVKIVRFLLEQQILRKQGGPPGFGSNHSSARVPRETMSPGSGAGGLAIKARAFPLASNASFLTTEEEHPAIHRLAASRKKNWEVLCLKHIFTLSMTRVLFTFSPGEKRQNVLKKLTLI